MFLLKKWHYYLLDIVLLIVLLMGIGSCKSHTNDQYLNVIPTYKGLDYREDYDQKNPRQICDYFSVNLLHNPERAYLLCKYKKDCPLEQFIQLRNMILPTEKNITSIEFVKAEHGFTETPSGVQSSEYTYKVRSKDDFFQSELTLQIDVAEEEKRYQIIRFAVTSE
jgi:hypothetical protein